MFKINKNQKCSSYGDRAECRLCGIITKIIKGSKVVSCNYKSLTKKIFIQTDLFKER
jgi:hypothetical protein